ncbi:hypothetical protein [Ketogulonicigenium robustum]|nr:hypothetical protein [Ketogulonicigenium robustum]
MADFEDLSLRIGRTICERWAEYHVRSRIETKKKMRLEARGKRIASSAPQRQTAEIHVRVALMNRFNARSTAVLERAA